MSQNIVNFYQSSTWVFYNFMKTLAFTMVFEDHKNIWVYQKCLHSTIVLCGKEKASQIIYEMIMKEEKDEVRK